MIELRTRIGVGVDYLAAALVTIAVVGLPAWALALADRGGQWWLVFAFVLALALAAPALRRLVHADRLLSSGGKSLVLLAGATLVTWIVAVIVGYVAYGIDTYSGLCGGGAAGVTAVIGGFAVFIAVGAWAIASPRFVVVWAMPLAPVAGFAWALASLAVIPGGHGYCETGCASG